MTLSPRSLIGYSVYMLQPQRKMLVDAMLYFAAFHIAISSMLPFK